MSHIKVEGNPHLYRDEESFAIINTDTNAFVRAKKIKERINTQDLSLIHI